MIRFAWVLALFASVSPALALSCLRPDAVRIYEQARDSEDLFVIVRGRLDLVGPAREPDPESNLPAVTMARVNGFALTSHGFGAVFDRDVMVEAVCLGPWCGSAVGFEGEQLMGLRVSGGIYSLTADPCGSFAVPWSKEGETRLLACHRSDTCEAADF